MFYSFRGRLEVRLLCFTSRCFFAVFTFVVGPRLDAGWRFFPACFSFFFRPVRRVSPDTATRPPFSMAVFLCSIVWFCLCFSCLIVLLGKRPKPELMEMFAFDVFCVEDTVFFLFVLTFFKEVAGLMRPRLRCDIGDEDDDDFEMLGRWRRFLVADTKDTWPCDDDDDDGDEDVFALCIGAWRCTIWSLTVVVTGTVVDFWTTSFAWVRVLRRFMGFARAYPFAYGFLSFPPPRKSKRAGTPVMSNSSRNWLSKNLPMCSPSIGF